MEEEGRQDQETPRGLFDNMTGKPLHECKQEERIKKLEEQQAQDMKNISKKLDKIWTAITDGDKNNVKMIIQVVGYFLAAMVALFLGFLAFIKFT